MEEYLSMAEGNDKEPDMHPLVLESSLFLKNFEEYRKNDGAVDAALLHTLNEIVLNVNNFLQEKQGADLPKPITDINVSNLEYVLQCYRCSRCQNLFRSMPSIMAHIDRKCSTKAVLDISLNNQTKCLLTYKDESEFLHKLRLAEKLQFLQEYDTIQNDLMKVLKKAFPKQHVKVHFFGSRINGLSNRRSDLDIYTEIDYNFRIYEENPSSGTQSKLNKLFRKLSKSKNWMQLIAIRKTKVPIIKAVHSDTGIECDISLVNGLGVTKTHLLTYLFELQPLARCLCIHIKEWILLTDIKKSMTSYSWILMVIFFFQKQHLLPSIKDLQDKIDYSKALTVGPWLATFNCYSRSELKLDVLPITLSCCQQYMKKFFNYYINFNYNKFIICPYLGKELECHEFQNYMPHWYTSHTENNPNEFLRTSNEHAIIQDPIKLNYNTVRIMYADKLQLIIKYMSLSEEILSNLA